MRIPSQIYSPAARSFPGPDEKLPVEVDLGATPPTIHNKEVHLRFLQFKGWSLPVTIDPFDARFMWDAKNPNPMSRPGPHQLLLNLAKQMKGQVVYGCVTDCQNGVYHADLRIGLPAQAATSKCSTLDMDCRPSDCINACLRAGAPIYVHRRIAKERAVYTPPTPSNVQKSIRESCLAEELQHQDPTFFMRMQLQLYISMDQFEVAERMRTNLNETMLGFLPSKEDKPQCQYTIRTLLVAMRAALEDDRLDEAAVFRDELKAWRMGKRCNNQWTPLAIGGTVALAVLCVLLLLILVFQGLVRWYNARQGSTMVGVASAAAAELRNSKPELYPEAEHCWYRLAMAQLTAPLLCCECHRRLQPDGLHKMVQCCEVCGLLAHEGCKGQVAADCRPVAVAAEALPHHWQPAGVVLDESEDEGPEAGGHTCLYCRSPCEPTLFTVEPMWRCGWCRCTAHVRCYHDAHQAQSLEEAGQQERTASVTGDGGSKPVSRSSSMEGMGDGPGPAASSPGLEDPSANGLSHPDASREVPANGKRHGKRRRRQQLSMAARAVTSEAERAPAQPLLRQCSAELPSTPQGVMDEPKRKHRRVRSFGGLLSSLTSVVSSIDLSALQAPAVTSPPTKLVHSVDVHNLDICSLSSTRRLVLPPTSVRPLPEASWTDRAAQFLARSTGSKKEKRGGRGGGKAGSHKQASKGGARRAKSTWWGRPQTTQWQRHVIEHNSPLRTQGGAAGVKPLLVFLNTRSGPQVGATLRRQFLRLLNPLQVVELPREKPETALQLFAHVPNLRIVVVGGDGTVGWIMGCLDAMVKSNAETGEPGPAWTPPPLAILPLGTGNDLARCLNWGGGLAALREQGLPAALAQIEQASLSLLDRWQVAIQPLASQPPTDPGQARKAAPSLQQRAESAIHSIQSQPKRLDKVMNNYLGIGIDAKVALDFHSMREEYPAWFQSQMGNKLWYTGLGAKDIIEHVPISLPRKLQVICDGQPLQVPHDIEGILLLNISSYMGGANLWASGRPLPASSLPDDAPQSHADGLLEVVGVYGSWHLGRLQVGLSRAVRLCQCSTATVTLSKELPIQVDGEPWMQAPAKMDITCRGHAFMLRRIGQRGPWRAWPTRLPKEYALNMSLLHAVQLGLSSP
ncbi:hypothetical protein WJX84_000838 [Apatococcus fuscideae]|uniref:Diacylglycerol kinase n=1 Tax=Apatococcus fuscideae TaxID=2026836 RepID=A0AAW1ST29_9CHLO